MRSFTSAAPLKLIKFLVFLISIAEPSKARAQSDSLLNPDRDQEKIFSITGSFQQATIFSYRSITNNTKGSYPRAGVLAFGWQKNDSASVDHCNCYPRIGLLLTYVDFENPILGKGILAAHFLEPVYRMGRKNAFSFMAAIGIIHLTNPFDSVNNPNNQSYSTHFSPYMMLGLGVWFRLSSHWWLNSTVNFQHASNGGIHRPNIGLNWPSAAIGLSYNKNPRPFFKGIRNRSRFWKGDSPRFDLAAFAMAKNAESKKGGTHWYPITGIHFQGSKQISRHDALVIGAEIFRDGALRARLEKDNISASAVRAGILIGHEFLLNKVIFSQRIGIYVYDKTPYFPSMYLRWSLHYRLTDHLGAGFSLLSHKAIADFIDLRVIYSFQRKGMKK